MSRTSTGSASSPPPREYLARGRYLSLIREGTWEFASRNPVLGAVLIVPVTPEGELVLVEQYRVPVAARVLELPAGLVGDIPGEATDDWGRQAERELLEETGFAARRVRRLAEGPVSAGFGDERVEFWIATGLTRVHAGGGVEHEQITVHVVPLPEVPGWLERQRRRGCLVDLRVYAGLWFAERWSQGRRSKISPTSAARSPASSLPPRRRGPARPRRENQRSQGDRRSTPPQGRVRKTEARVESQETPGHGPGSRPPEAKRRKRGRAARG